MTFEQRGGAIGMLTTGISARDIARHFQCRESTISPLPNRFQQTGNVTGVKARLSLNEHSTDVTELLSLLLYCICNNITLGFSNIRMPDHTLRGIPRTFYALKHHCVAVACKITGSL